MMILTGGSVISSFMPDLFLEGEIEVTEKWDNGVLNPEFSQE